MFTKMVSLFLVFLSALCICWTTEDIFLEPPQLPDEDWMSGLPQPPEDNFWSSESSEDDYKEYESSGDEYTEYEPSEDDWRRLLEAQATQELTCETSLAYCQQAYKLNTSGRQGIDGGKADAIPPQDMSFDSLRRHLCFCDPDCHRFGDCCLDNIITMDPYHTVKAFEDSLLDSRKEDEREWECHEFPNMMDAQLYMIGTCPTTYKNIITKNRCRRQVPEQEYDYTLDVPVLSRETNVTYVNVFCAICNDDVQMLHEWEILIQCPFEKPNCIDELHSWKYYSGSRHWLQTRESSSISASFEISTRVNFYHEFGARKCRTMLIDTCPVNWRNDRERTLCETYALVVKSENPSRYRSGIFYKNEYCAICNGESPNYLHCPTGIPTVARSVGSIKVPHTVLLDFMGHGPHGVPVGRAAGGGCGSDGPKCGFGELCDAVFKKCRVYTCGLMYEMDVDGKCVASGNETVSQYLNSTCPKIYLTEDNFTRHLNNSVYFETMDKMYSLGEYELVNSTTILVCTTHDSITWKFSMAQAYLSKVCVTLSLICLVANVLVHVLTPGLLNLPGKNMVSLSITLIMAQLSFEFGVTLASSFELCLAIALTIHFGFLASILWMNVIALDVFRTFSSINKFRTSGTASNNWKFKVYCAYAWSMAFVLVLASYTNDLTHWMPGYEPKYGQPLCWINDRRGLLTFFAVPLAILLTANVVLFAITVTAICQTRATTESVFRSSSAKFSDRRAVFLYFKLALIMGFTWVSGLVAALANVEVIWYVFIVCNGLQGAFIFVGFSCKRTIFLKLKQAFSKFCPRKQVIPGVQIHLEPIQIKN